MVAKMIITSAKSPPRGINAVQARAYAEAAQMKSEPWRSSMMVGNAVATQVCDSEIVRSIMMII